ncbi:hypothetical protein CEXT_86711 [Caerostris extrusa]|uniref:Uncharacterized protein n=1 Tax=Caerostris extrusa TaxID=172846 RepID=A0AAV4XDL7_CAEEX|nr:hypothetical protein CEXT_86711 [Caerostris extrusa]
MLTLSIGFEHQFNHESKNTFTLTTASNYTELYFNHYLLNPLNKILINPYLGCQSISFNTQRRKYQLIVQICIQSSRIKPNCSTAKPLNDVFQSFKTQAVLCRVRGIRTQAAAATCVLKPTTDCHLCMKISPNFMLVIGCN